MESLSSSTPIRPLHAEIDGMSKCRQAYSVEDLAAFLLSEKCPHLENDPVRFHHALATSMDAMQLYLDPEMARQAFVEAAHASSMHVLPDDMEGIRQSDEG
ncbi:MULTISPECIES: DUF982 domain-containing protein [unclassified Rhizobium]|jgi:hypothetical protein|uniref:DUF982 domain-containing protein n=1 Tax=unclassified Rhizobium TaxID=2613769 RepID=UPI0003612041|nr:MULTISPECIES: DUF982 domain-containing protein [unclassified Rhizobium]MBB3447065.1 hypothetical protein [Rhizobium sp. BK379]MBB3565593.1 hypothetical protein [Rhizobium sp. BK512]